MIFLRLIQSFPLIFPKTFSLDPSMAFNNLTFCEGILMSSETGTKTFALDIQLPKSTLKSVFGGVEALGMF
jgi:hypothetical protein